MDTKRPRARLPVSRLRAINTFYWKKKKHKSREFKNVRWFFCGVRLNFDGSPVPYFHLPHQKWRKTKNLFLGAGRRSHWNRQFTTYVNTGYTCTLEWKIWTHVYEIHANRLSVFTCYLRIHGYLSRPVVPNLSKDRWGPRPLLYIPHRHVITITVILFFYALNRLQIISWTIFST